MKRYIAMAALLIGGLASAQQNKPVLEEVNGMVKVTYYYENGKVQQEGFYKEGKLEGKWISYDENGNVVSTPCEPEPEGVQYDRFVPHLLNLVKRQKEQIETQAASIAALEARLTALEGQ